MTSDKAPSSFMADGSPTLSSMRRIICFNCGGVGHPVNECKLPKDDKAIELRKSIMMEAKSAGGSSGGQKQTNPLTVPPKKNEPHEKLFNGVKMFWCGKRGCRCWGNHRTKEHPPDVDGSDNANLADANNNQDDTTATNTTATPSNSPPSEVRQSSGDSVSAYSATGLHFG